MMLAGRKGKLRMKIDVIIPVYKPEKRFLELISRLEKQKKNILKLFCMVQILPGSIRTPRCTIFPSGNSIMVEPEMMERPAAQGIFSYA